MCKTQPVVYQATLSTAKKGGSCRPVAEFLSCFMVELHLYYYYYYYYYY